MLNKNSQDLIAIGKISSSFGIKGEVKLNLFERNFADLKKIKQVWIGFSDDNTFVAEIENARLIGSLMVVKFNTFSNPEELKNIANAYLFVNKNDRLKLKKEKYFIDDLIGLEVVDDLNKKKIGVLLKIEKYPAQDIYVIETNGKTVMLPAVKEYVKKIDLDERKIFILPTEGIFDL